MYKGGKEWCIEISRDQVRRNAPTRGRNIFTNGSHFGRELGKRMGSVGKTKGGASRASASGIKPSFVIYTADCEISGARMGLGFVSNPLATLAYVGGCLQTIRS